MVLLHTQQTIKQSCTAAVWALDYCLTLEHEVRLFSKMGRWNITTVMFIVARYVPICLTTYRTAGVSLLLIMLAAEGLLLMRTLALWHDNRKIKRFLWASYLVMFRQFVVLMSDSMELEGLLPSPQSFVVQLRRLFSKAHVCPHQLRAI
ncbi:uncharacterized protein BJ212DRAFT_1410977, partial [Suillus subaureus]